MSNQFEQTGNYYIIEHVALQGEPITKAGWPAKASSFEEALSLAKKYNAVAFHYYDIGDEYHTHLYLFSNVTGVESRNKPRNCSSIFMERNSVHSLKNKKKTEKK